MGPPGRTFAPQPPTPPATSAEEILCSSLQLRLPSPQPPLGARSLTWRRSHLHFRFLAGLQAIPAPTGEKNPPAPPAIPPQRLGFSLCAPPPPGCDSPPVASGSAAPDPLIPPAAKNGSVHPQTDQGRIYSLSCTILWGGGGWGVSAPWGCSITPPPPPPPRMLQLGLSTLP